MNPVTIIFEAVWGLILAVYYGIRLLFRFGGYVRYKARYSGVTEYHAINTSRFEHTLIVGGSGHGKTQLLQSLILYDLPLVAQGKQSVIVIDSQGDMINKILDLEELAPPRQPLSPPPDLMWDDDPPPPEPQKPAAQMQAGNPPLKASEKHPTRLSLSDRLVLIDPTDVENPPCLNLFDFGVSRAKEYPPLEREMLVNGAIAMYEYVFSALLGAELTNRQGVIFRYLARLMMEIPDATIYTLMDFMEDPSLVKPYLSKLDIATQRFFLTQFGNPTFEPTRQQILHRLWGVLSNNTLAKMFSHKENKLNLFEAMNNGSLILINTAKALLKQDGCELFGRFMVALLSQAVQERAALAPSKRLPTFVYIDEAHDYFDENIDLLFNTARKYNVGIIIATQNLGQFGRQLLETVLSSTSIKYAGGVSDHDARILAPDMKCTPESIMELSKTERQSYFAIYDKHRPARADAPPTAYVVNFGVMESEPKMTAGERRRLIAENRKRFCAPYDPGLLMGSQAVVNSGIQFNLDEPREL